MIASTKAIDLDCTDCGAKAGNYCSEEGARRFCQARLNAAAKRTRDANAALRKAKR